MEAYRDALQIRRQGGDLAVVSLEWPSIKPLFYADSRILSEGALKVFDQLEETHPPFGLVDEEGESITDLFAETNLTPFYGPWSNLNTALRTTGRYVMETALPGIESCPYAGVLQEKLQPTRPDLKPFDHDERGLDTLRSVATPGAMLNASLFTSLIRVMPRLARLHGETRSNQEQFAINSVHLLNEPLSHPQQRAAAFVFCLGSLGELLKSGFLPDELAQEYTKIEPSNKGGNRLAWAIPTQDFRLRAPVTVTSRVESSERNTDTSLRASYPIGTRLGDIAVDEPTIGCPGNRLAHAVWQRTVKVVVNQSLWELSPSPL